MRADRAGQGPGQLIGDVQRLGLISAARVIDRYTKLVDSADGATAPASRTDRDAAQVALATRLAEAYLRLVDATAELASAVGRGDPGTTMERVALGTARPGSQVQARLWIHNPTEEAVQAEVAMTDLTSSKGDSVPGAVISLTPRRVGRLDPFTSREVRIRVDVPDDQPTGCYHGLVLVTAAPADPVAVQLEVVPHRDDRSGEG